MVLGLAPWWMGQTEQTSFLTQGVISCLHANLAALEAVLADIDQQGVDTITCLGDLVGYGPQPNEVVE